MKTLLSAVLLLAAPFAFADDIADWEKEVNRLTAEMDKADASMQQFENNLSKAEATLKKNKCSYNLEAGKQTFKCPDGISNEQLGEVGLAFSQGYAALIKLEPLRKKKDALQAAADALRPKEEAKLEPKRDVAASIEALHNLTKINEGENKLNAHWTDLVEGKGDLVAALDELEDHMDQSAMGMYFQDKMGQFVNSSLFCQARKRCLVPERKEVDNKYLKELFPYMSDKNSRSSKKYYDKTKKRRGNK